MTTYNKPDGQKVYFEECKEKTLSEYQDGTELIPGYLVDCTDGNTYLLFAPDMSCLKYMHAYSHIIRMAKDKLTDHDYDPVRKMIRPAFCDYKTKNGKYAVFQMPVSCLGKVYKLVKESEND